MEKLGFSTIAFEVTRQCNLKCSHCMRGDSQNIILSTRAIDNFLNQTLGIDNILFTGGEPLLAIDKIEYIIDGIIKRDIVVREMQIITNGTVVDENFYKIIHKAHLYLRMLHERVYGNDLEYNKRNLLIGISYDQYHNTEKIRKKTYENFQRNIGEDAYIVFQDAGENVSKIGRAKNMDCGKKVNEDIPFKIEIFGKGRSCYCPSLPAFIDNTDYYNVICNLELNAKGYLTKQLKYGEYDFEDKEIFRISDLNESNSIISDINKYNENKPLCLMAQKIIREKENETRHNLKDVYSNFKEMYNAYKRLCEHDDETLFKVPDITQDYMNKMFRSLYDVKDDDDFQLKGMFYTFPKDENKIIESYYQKEIYSEYPFLTDNERNRIRNNIDVSKLSMVNFEREVSQKINEMKKYDCATEEELQAIYKIMKEINNVEEAVEVAFLVLYKSIDIKEKNNSNDSYEFIFYNKNIIKKFYKNMKVDYYKTIKNIIKAEEFVRLCGLINNFIYTHNEYIMNGLNKKTYKNKAYEYLGAVDVYLYNLEQYDYKEVNEYFEITNEQVELIKSNLYRIKKVYISLLDNPLLVNLSSFLGGIF